MPGTDTLIAEVIHVSRFGIWLAVGEEEYFLDFSYFPWFKDASIEAICNVVQISLDHFYWPQLDIDLDLDIIQNPQKYPLTYK